MALWGKKTKSEPAAEPVVAAPPAPAPVAASPAPQAAEPPPSPPPAAPPQQQPAQANGAQPQAMSPEEAQKRAVASKQLLMSFGEIVSVLMRNPQFKAVPLGEIEALVVPAVTTGQFLVAEAQSKANGFVTPIGTVLWASVSEEVDRRLSSNLDQPFKLAPNEWRSGDIPWLVALAGDQRIINPMIKQLQETRLNGRGLKMRVKGQDGKPTVGVFNPAAAAAQAQPATA